MFDYIEMMERAQTGEFIKENDWDLQRVALTTRQLVKKYRLEWDRGRIVTDDDALADAVFQAGLELAVQLGAYNRSLERVLRFSEDELREGLRSAPQALTVGEGKDARNLYARHVEDQRLPLNWGGTPGTPFPEDLFLPNVVSYVQEPLLDMLTCGTLTSVDGREIRTGSPMEIVATRRELRYLHEALQRGGRPGMGLLAAQSSVSELGDLAVAHPNYLRPCDAHLVPMLNELKIDGRNIARVVNSLEYGMLNASLACVLVGGLGGDAPGSAVVQAASFILANLACAADYHLLHPVDIRHVATSTRHVLWVTSIVGQAFARNAPCILVADVYPKSGAGTREVLYETAANAVAIAVTGSHLEGCGSADGRLPNASGLEARWMAEVGRAACLQGWSRREANDLVLALLPKYEWLFEPGAPANTGQSFNVIYDQKTIRPVLAWEKIYQEVKMEVRSLGLSKL
jgi:methylamine--corrinoid protein Co-methyltransferase